MLEAGTVLNDRYEIKEKIGAGGMSIVYRAKCRKLLRDVAIKVLREEFVQDEAFVASFRAEALAAASLSHPNIVGIYDVGSDLGVHYIVMEYVDGKTLKELIDQEAPYDTNKVLEYGVDLLSAIRHAHMKKIIHRDIKPQNILVTSDHILKVTDFGIARAVDSSTIVSTGTAIGSVHYFSPEQARGKYVDETSDLYSCGIVLYELATGKLPFEADSHVSVALKHINEEVPRPTLINANIGQTLENIILKATQKRPELRYASSDDMLQDMRRLQSNPAYKIAGSINDINQPTILMTPEETDMIRKNANIDGELNIPSWQETNPRASLYNAIDRVDEADEEEEDEEEASKAYTIMVTLAGILAAMVLVGIVTFFALPMFGKMSKPKVVAVPNLIEKHIDEATKELEDRGLEIKVVDEEEKEGITTGEILRQAPVRDQIVNIGTVIEVIIGKEIEVIEPELSLVPDIMGMDFAQAQAELLDRDLILQVTDRKFDDTIEVGMIISQSPMSGNRLEQGDVVSVIVSKGKEIITIPVPNVVGMDENAAISTLQNSGLKVGAIDHEDNETVEKGRVISQGMPEGMPEGRPVEKSTSISIVVSKGKKEVEPPKEVISSKTLTISIPGFLEEKENYQVLVRLITDSGDTTIIYQGLVEWEQFPITVQVKGTGKGTVETYIDNEPIYADPIDFDEVNQ